MTNGIPAGSYAVFKDGNLLADIILKYPHHNASTLSVFVHIMGQQPVEVEATGNGYDKARAALQMIDLEHGDDNELYNHFLDTPDDWCAMLERVGYTVFQVA